MSPLATIDLEALVAPATGGSPAGPDLRYQPIYDEIKAARRQTDADPVDLAPWKRVLDLVLRSLTRSKDLQLAVWLLEALTKLDGYAGASTGLTVVRRLLAERWDTLYPELDPEDADPAAFRLSLINWLNDKYPLILKAAPLTAPPALYSLLHYEVTQKTGDQRRAFIEEGWPSSEQFDRSLMSSPAPHLTFVLEHITTCEHEVATLEETITARLASAAGRSDGVSFGHLKQVLSTAQWLVERPLKKAPSASAAATVSAVGTTPANPQEWAANGDNVWSEALNFTRDSRIDGLRLLQTQVAAASHGRDRFLKQLQFAELCVEAGVQSLAYPIYDELARIIDARDLENWEDRALITRVWVGLRQCCRLLESHLPAAVARGREIDDRINGVTPAEPPPES